MLACVLHSNYHSTIGHFVRVAQKKILIVQKEIFACIQGNVGMFDLILFNNSKVS